MSTTLYGIHNFTSLLKYILSLPVRFPGQNASAFLSAIVIPPPSDHRAEMLLIYCTNYKNDTCLKYALFMDFVNRDSLSQLDTLCLAPVMQLSYWSRLVSNSICFYIWTLLPNFLIQGWSFIALYNTFKMKVDRRNIITLTPECALKQNMV